MIQNRKKILFFLWLVICSIQSFQLSMLHLRQPEKIDGIEIVFLVGTSFLVGWLLIHILLIPVFDYLQAFSRLKKTFFLITTGVFYSGIYIIIIFFIPLIKHGKGWHWYFKTVEQFVIFDFHNTFKNYLFLTAALFAHDFLKKEQSVFQKKQLLEKELIETKLEMLKSQLQPHFLFNSLNGIVALIDENKSKAKKMIIGLSDLLRITLNTDFKKTHTLGEELKILDHYLNIEKNRYENQLIYRFNSNDQASKLLLPILILQPLVENAIKHGYKGIDYPLEIVIEANYSEKWVLVKNNGAPLNEKIRYGKGLQQVEERLKIASAKKGRLEISKKNNWIINKLIFE